MAEGVKGCALTYMDFKGSREREGGKKEGREGENERRKEEIENRKKGAVGWVRQLQE